MTQVYPVVRATFFVGAPLLGIVSLFLFTTCILGPKCIQSISMAKGASWYITVRTGILIAITGELTRGKSSTTPSGVFLEIQRVLNIIFPRGTKLMSLLLLWPL